MTWLSRLAAVEQRLEATAAANADVQAALKTIAAEAEIVAARDRHVMQALQEVSTRLLEVEMRAATAVEMMHAMSGAIAALTENMAPVDDLGRQVSTSARELTTLTDTLASLRDRLEERDTEIAKLRSAVTWLEHRTASQAAETRKSVTALLQIIDLPPRGNAVG